mmetsp:Transcript_24007/g.23068  ORF Transcript_24007/g.23068 Transcript_24007/m.23068 type:complete len:82 (-) Transcript_24007:362-607(-)
MLPLMTFAADLSSRSTYWRGHEAIVSTFYSRFYEKIPNHGELRERENASCLAPLPSLIYLFKLYYPLLFAYLNYIIDGLSS